jgi:hypothetical protein
MCGRGEGPKDVKKLIKSTNEESSLKNMDREGYMYVEKEICIHG